ncbi:MAG TPA: zinc metalloprotease HtpX [Ilumatobacter sp.]
MFKNTMKTTVLLAGLGGLIVAVAGILGGGSAGSLLFGLVIALVMVGGSYWFSDKLALKSAKAQIVTEAQAPEFFAMIRRLSERAGMPMPTVAISPAAQPNAFATGRGPKHAVVCATQGLLQTLPADEVEGVMAHELMHVKHRDILIGSVAAAIATAISFMAQMTIYSSMFGGRRDRNGNPLIMLAAAILAPIAASLIQMAVSRSREFQADESGAFLSSDPQPLASALQKLEQTSRRVPPPHSLQPGEAHMFIVNPLSALKGRGLTSLFSTHPPTEERVSRLMAMQDEIYRRQGPIGN